MREALSSGSPAFRQRTVSRDDILSRYRGSNAGSTGRVADTRDVRQQLADTPMLSDTRRSRTTDARRTRTDDTRSRDARDTAARRRSSDSGDARADARRTQAAREARAERDARRTAEARKNYMDSVNGQRDNMGLDRVGDVNSPGGGDDGHDGGHDGDHHGHHDHFNQLYWGYWGGYGCSPFSWWWSWPGYCYGYWWNSYWYNGGYWNYGYRPNYYWYGPYLPYGYSTVYQVNGYQDQDVIYTYEDEPIEGEVYPEEAAPQGAYEGAPVPQPGDGLNRAADYYLTLGDRAFREGRYGDAVHFYAKAVEYASDEGILYLILADALFATGDYHYAGYSLRKALELDPLLAQNVVDKHSFYADPADFDRQLEVLEKYLEDHFLDNDARLVLAANYLFGGRPAAAIELLQSAFSLEIQQSLAGQLLLDSAQSLVGSSPDAGDPQPAGRQAVEND